MRVILELKVESTGDTFLNFWDYHGGKDVCCKITKDGTLIDDNGDGREITLIEFIALVKAGQVGEWGEIS